MAFHLGRSDVSVIHELLGLREHGKHLRIFCPFAKVSVRIIRECLYDASEHRVVKKRSHCLLYFQLGCQHLQCKMPTCSFMPLLPI